jgi:hypothetical protein
MYKDVNLIKIYEYGIVGETDIRVRYLNIPQQQEYDHQLNCYIL